MTHSSEPSPTSERAERPPEHQPTSGSCGSIDAGLLAVDWQVSHTDATTLVTVQVTNTHTEPREARVENRLDGAVLPPRRHGVAETGWDDDGVTRHVAGEETLSVGYACHAPPETPPVEVSDGPVADTDDDTPVDRALRSLGAHAPPRAVVSGGRFEASASTPAADSVESVTSSDPAASATSPTPPTSPTSAAPTAARESVSDPSESGDPTDSPNQDVPTAVASWFQAVEVRLDTADRLAGDVHEATPVVASLGGRPGVEVLETTLAADATALARVAARANELAARADATTLPDLGDVGDER